MVELQELEAIRAKYGIDGVDLDKLADMNLDAIEDGDCERNFNHEDDGGSKCLCGPGFCEYNNMDGNKKHIMQVGETLCQTKLSFAVGF